MREIPIVKLDSVRGLVLLWVTTDPRDAWTSSSICDELEDMGIPRGAALGAIKALRQRGLLYPGTTRNRRQDHLRASSFGHHAIRSQLPCNTVGAA